MTVTVVIEQTGAALTPELATVLVLAGVAVFAAATNRFIRLWREPTPPGSA